MWKLYLRTKEASSLKVSPLSGVRTIRKDQKATVPVLFSSSQVIDMYSESSDVSGEVYRCDVTTGSVMEPRLSYSHYPECEGRKRAVAEEDDRGVVFYDYCEEHSQD